MADATNRIASNQNTNSFPVAAVADVATVLL